MEEINIRKAGKSDMQKLLPIMTQAVVGRLKTLDMQSLFEEDNIIASKHSPASIYVSDASDGNIQGYLLSYYGYSTRVGRTVILEDVFVLPECRRRRIASALLREMLKEALATGCHRCDVCTARPSEFLPARGFVRDSINIAFKMEMREMELNVKKRNDLGEIKIRQARETDCQDLAEAAKGLFVYLKDPEAMDINDKDFMKDGFGSRPSFKCYVAERDDLLVGYSLFFATRHLDGPGVYMEDLYVSQDCRGKGVGSALWKMVMKDCLLSGGKECSFCVDYRNTSSLQIYKHKGAIDMTTREGYKFYHLNEEAMEKLCK